jgi:hypothetical protein
MASLTSALQSQEGNTTIRKEEKQAEGPKNNPNSTKQDKTKNDQTKTTEAGVELPLTPVNIHARASNVKDTCRDVLHMCFHCSRS